MRLIDADELKKVGLFNGIWDKKNGNIHFMFGIETVVDYINNLSTVDAVEVVRCKDCVHFMEYTPEYTAKVEHADGDCRVRLMRSDDPEFNGVLKNEFCSLGESWAERGENP